LVGKVCSDVGHPAECPTHAAMRLRHEWGTRCVGADMMCGPPVRGLFGFALWIFCETLVESLGRT